MKPNFFCATNGLSTASLREGLNGALPIFLREAGVEARPEGARPKKKLIPVEMCDCGQRIGGFVFLVFDKFEYRFAIIGAIFY